MEDGKKCLESRMTKDISTTVFLLWKTDSAPTSLWFLYLLLFSKTSSRPNTKHQTTILGMSRTSPGLRCAVGLFAFPSARRHILIIRLAEIQIRHDEDLETATQTRREGSDVAQPYISEI
jgi:hypothetical protein